MTPAPETGLFEPNSYVHPTNLSLPAADTARPLNSGEVEAGLRRKIEEIRARVERTICPTFSSDAGDVGEQGRISREDFEILSIAALSSAPSTPEGWQ